MLPLEIGWVLRWCVFTILAILVVDVPLSLYSIVCRRVPVVVCSSLAHLLFLRILTCCRQSMSTLLYEGP